jgi:hypothetical protein
MRESARALRAEGSVEKYRRLIGLRSSPPTRRSAATVGRSPSADIGSMPRAGRVEGYRRQIGRSPELVTIEERSNTAEPPRGVGDYAVNLAGAIAVSGPLSRTRGRGPFCYVFKRGGLSCNCFLTQITSVRIMRAGSNSRTKHASNGRSASWLAWCLSTGRSVSPRVS